MLRTPEGLVVPEENDNADPATIVEYGMAADSMLAEMDEALDLLERPPCVIGYLSVAAGPYAYGPYYTVVDMDLRYANRGGSVSMYIRPPNYPGIWHVGGSVDIQPIAVTPTSFTMQLVVNDKRGPRLENTVIEYTEVTTGYGFGGPCTLTCAGLFEVHTPDQALMSAQTRVIGGGGGSYTINTNTTRIWAHYVRGLTDV
jgi:hypothetical protein